MLKPTQFCLYQQINSDDFLAIKQLVNNLIPKKQGRFISQNYKDWLIILIELENKYVCKVFPQKKFLRQDKKRKEKSSFSYRFIFKIKINNEIRYFTYSFNSKDGFDVTTFVQSELNRINNEILINKYNSVNPFDWFYSYNINSTPYQNSYHDLLDVPILLKKQNNTNFSIYCNWNNEFPNVFNVLNVWGKYIGKCVTAKSIPYKKGRLVIGSTYACFSDNQPITNIRKIVGYPFSAKEINTNENRFWFQFYFSTADFYLDKETRTIVYSVPFFFYTPLCSYNINHKTIDTFIYDTGYAVEGAFYNLKVAYWYDPLSGLSADMLNYPKQVIRIIDVNSNTPTVIPYISFSGYYDNNYLTTTPCSCKDLLENTNFMGSYHRVHTLSDYSGAFYFAKFTDVDIENYHKFDLSFFNSIIPVNTNTAYVKSIKSTDNKYTCPNVSDDKIITINSLPSEVKIRRLGNAIWQVNIKCDFGVHKNLTNAYVLTPSLLENPICFFLEGDDDVSYHFPAYPINPNFYCRSQQVYKLFYIDKSVLLSMNINQEFVFISNGNDYDLVYRDTKTYDGLPYEFTVKQSDLHNNYFCKFFTSNIKSDLKIYRNRWTKRGFSSDLFLDYEILSFDPIIEEEISLNTLYHFSKNPNVDIYKLKFNLHNYKGIQYVQFNTTSNVKSLAFLSNLQLSSELKRYNRFRDNPAMRRVFLIPDGVYCLSRNASLKTVCVKCLIKGGWADNYFSNQINKDLLQFLIYSEYPLVSLFNGVFINHLENFNYISTFDLYPIWSFSYNEYVETIPLVPTIIQGQRFYVGILYPYYYDIFEEFKKRLPIKNENHLMRLFTFNYPNSFFYGLTNFIPIISYNVPAVMKLSAEVYRVFGVQNLFNLWGLEHSYSTYPETTHQTINNYINLTKNVINKMCEDVNIQPKTSILFRDNSSIFSETYRMYLKNYFVGYGYEPEQVDFHYLINGTRVNVPYESNYLSYFVKYSAFYLDDSASENSEGILYGIVNSYPYTPVSNTYPEDVFEIIQLYHNHKDVKKEVIDFIKKYYNINSEVKLLSVILV